MKIKLEKGEILEIEGENKYFKIELCNNGQEEYLEVNDY
jgi:hypothetical protein